MLSGIGPAAALRALDIPVQVDLAGVGQNLQDHLRIPVLYETSRRSPGDMLYWIPAALEYGLLRKGVLTSNCCEAGAVLRSGVVADAPDLQFVTHFQSALYPGTVDLQFCLTARPAAARCDSTPPTPTSPPSSTPTSYPPAPTSRPRSPESAWPVPSPKPPRSAASPLGAEVLPGPALTAPSELEAYVRWTAETCYHPAGTCRMGSDSGAVVDPDLKLRGVDALRVVDASVMPELPNGNTCAIVLMLAERAAGRMLP